MTDITFTWEFPHWTVQPKQNGFENVLSEVYWRLAASDGENTVKVQGTVKLKACSKDSFIPKEQITKEQLIEWVKPLMGYDAYAEQLAATLEGMHPRPFVEAPHFNPPADPK